MDDRGLWELTQSAWSALNPHFEPAIQQVIEESQLEPQAWGLLLAAMTLEPEETTAGHLIVRTPFTSADHFHYRLKNIAAAGYLAEVHPGKFRLTAPGHTAVDRFIDRARFAMTHSDPLPLEESGRLADLLEKLVEACLKQPPPPGTWCIGLSYKLMPEKEPPLPYIEQAFTCLDAYREDAHLAAWRSSGLSAVSLEVLTLLWRDDVHSLDEILEKLSRRGHDRMVYSDALSDLRQRGYLAGDVPALSLTEAGRQFRGKIEDETNRLFLIPWKALSPEEKDEMAGMLARLRDGLQAEE